MDGICKIEIFQSIHAWLNENTSLNNSKGRTLCEARKKLMLQVKTDYRKSPLLLKLSDLMDINFLQQHEITSLITVF